MDEKKKIKHGKSNRFISIKGDFDTDDRFTNVVMQHEQDKGGYIHGAKFPGTSYIRLVLPLLINQGEQAFVFPDDFPQFTTWTYHNESGRNFNAVKGKITITFSTDRASAHGEFSFASNDSSQFNGEFNLLRS